MSNILDQMASSYRQFRPQTPQEFFALQLAKRLKDEARLREYLILVDRYPRPLLLQAFQVATRTAKDGTAHSEQFHLQLNQLINQQEEQ